jgi:anaerobic magnesium-protoporphyrin IX monomethyl ester cyclase
MLDLLLIFPPQWSAFQPALSLPSLSAWLKRAGFEVRSLDLNLAFYEWLFSDECAEYLIGRVARSEWDRDVKCAYETTFRGARDFRRSIANLPSGAETPTGAEYVRRHYLAVKPFEIYLDAISQVCREFTVSPYEFRLQAGNLDTTELELQLESPPRLLEMFMRRVLDEHVLSVEAKVIGLSCIGQDQLYLTLLLGSLLKQRVNSPILVGGTIFSRIFERGVLAPGWFGRYFDVIVRNEGEKPAEILLGNIASERKLTDDVPGIVYFENGEVVSSVPCPPLTPREIPVPDFDDMPLGRYISGEITLPLLSARGCYWGKCEFCHHHMVYGGKYAPYEVGIVLDFVNSLAQRYDVRHFAFNDEAIPPKIIRGMGNLFPPHTETGWNFTGLIKFEKYFKREDFESLYKIGFRSLYVGLESASERVLDLMKKNNKKETVIRNLADATAAGVWMHCFLFFGFPGETDADAQETYDFVLEHSDIISSFGSATFVLEHNAPIFHHLPDFGVRLKEGKKEDIDVYYAFDTAEGITPRRAYEWMERLNVATLDIPGYNAAGWVPRELQLCMLAVMSSAELVEHGLAIRRHSGLPERARFSEIVTSSKHPLNDDCRIVVNRANGRALLAKGTSATLIDLCFANDLELGDVSEMAPLLFERLAGGEQKLSSEAVMSPVPQPL